MLISRSDNALALLDQLHRAGEPCAAVVGSLVNLNTGGMHPAQLCHVPHLCTFMYKV